MQISRRNLLKFCGFTGIGLATGAIRCKDSFAQDQGRIGLGLCIGLNSLDPARYYGSSGLLRGCVPDAQFMSGLLRGQGYLVRTLWDRPTADRLQRSSDVGTRANVEKWIKRAAAGLKSGDTFVVSYSGHGSSLPDSNGDEVDKRDETWCLFDGQMIDDERSALWTQFQPGVRIVVISDSCHSGTAQRVPLFADALINEAREAAGNEVQEEARQRGLRTRSADIDQAALQEADAAARKMEQAIKNVVDRPRAGVRARGENDESFSAIRQLPDEIKSEFNNDDRHRRDVEARQTNISRSVAEMRDGTLRTRVLAIGACQDRQTAGDLPSNGLFTARLKQVWSKGGFTNYLEFFDQIRDVMPDHQQPNLDIFGTQLANFENQRPFSK